VSAVILTAETRRNRDSFVRSYGAPLAGARKAGGLREVAGNGIALASGDVV